MDKVKILKPLPIYGGETLPAGTQITVTDDWDMVPNSVRATVILDPSGKKRLVVDEDLEYALGAH